jgi:hypothetical protein
VYIAFIILKKREMKNNYYILDDLNCTHAVIKASSEKEAMDIYMSPSKILPAPNQSLRSILKAVEK